MKKYYLYITVSFFVISCNKSEKGSWSDEDKTHAKEDLQKVGAALDVLGDRKGVFIDCYLEKIEDNYPSYDDAKKDKEGCDEQVANCMQQVILGE